MAQQTTSEGLTVEQIETAYEVLEVVREHHAKNDRDAMRNTVNEAHYLLQQYEQNADWSKDYDLPEPGDVLTDPESNPKYGDGRVEVVTVDETKEARTHYIDVETGKRSVAWLNPSHPADAPIVFGRYVEGSDKVYAFPCTRLVR